MSFAELIQGLKGKFSKKQDPKISGDGADSQDQSKVGVKEISNWYEERYDTVAVHRNILAILLVISLCAVLASVFVVGYVATSKKFEPFVIQIDEQTGETQVVNPVNDELISGNEALARYFIRKYVVARETYNAADFETYSRKLIRLYSQSDIYWSYIGYIRDKDNDPILKYGTQNSTYLKVRSWSKIDDNTYVLRFSLTEDDGSFLNYNKIAIIKISYVPMELSAEDREINPVGFQVVSYRIDNDYS